MLNRLEWLHDLDIQYDCSTFDTDPFEPQPEGWQTIFPFWVSAPEVQEGRGKNGSGNGKAIDEPRGGYVELPYTLPPNSTLFLLLGEQTPDIWLNKLDWIAEHGGMALVNVHPDYLRFDGEPRSGRTYSAAQYRQLLEHIHQRYGNVVWRALPKSVAEFTSQLKPRPAVRQAKRVCMVAYSYYETDGRVMRYAEALAERGDHVDVVALKRSLNEPAEAKVGGVNLYKLQLRVGKNERSPLAFLLPLLRFLLGATIWVARRHRRQPYDVLHIHNMPDFLVFAAAYPRLTGARVILDIHDIVPEFYGNKFGRGGRSRMVIDPGSGRTHCARIADRVIVSNHLWIEKYATRTGAKDKCSVFINHVDDAGVQAGQERPGRWQINRSFPRRAAVAPGPRHRPARFQAGEPGTAQRRIPHLRGRQHEAGPCQACGGTRVQWQGPVLRLRPHDRDRRGHGEAPTSAWCRSGPTRSATKLTAPRSWNSWPSACRWWCRIPRSIGITFNDSIVRFFESG